MIGFAIGVAIWFLVIMPAIVKLALRFSSTDSPEWREHIWNKIEQDLKWAKQEAEIRRLEMENIALSIYAESQAREQRMSYADVQRQFDCSQFCQFSYSPIRDAGTVEVVREEIKALPRGEE